MTLSRHVLTGAPGTGKTAVHDLVAERYCSVLGGEYRSVDMGIQPKDQESGDPASSPGGQTDPSMRASTIADESPEVRRDTACDECLWSPRVRYQGYALLQYLRTFQEEEHR